MNAVGFSCVLIQSCNIATSDKLILIRKCIPIQAWVTEYNKNLLKVHLFL